MTMSEQQKAKCKLILEHYGIESQKRMLIEECAELIQAVTKLERYGENAKTKQNLFAEVADVEVMIEQIKQAYNYGTDRLVEYKLDRQLKRITIETLEGDDDD